MRLMRVTSQKGPMRLNPQHVVYVGQRAKAPDGHEYTFVKLSPAHPQSLDSAVWLRDTLDAIAAEWSAALFEGETA